MINAQDRRDLHMLRHRLGLSDPAFAHALKRAAGVESIEDLRPHHLAAVASELGRLARREPAIFTAAKLCATRR